MSNTLPRSGSFVKDMFLERFSKRLSNTTLQDSEKTIAQSVWRGGVDESLTLVVFASASQSRLKINCTKIGQMPFIENNWPVPQKLVLDAIQTNSETLIVDILLGDNQLQKTIAAELASWGSEWANRSLKDRVSLPSLPASKSAPSAL